VMDYWGISLDDFWCAYDMDFPNEGPAAHYVTAKNKTALADAIAKTVRKWVLDNAYPSDDYGHPIQEEI